MGLMALLAELVILSIGAKDGAQKDTGLLAPGMSSDDVTDCMIMQSG